MAQKTELQVYSLPGQRHSFSAKTAAATTAIHIIATSSISPAQVADSADNLLIKGDLEVQGSIHAGDGVNFDGAITNLTIVNGIITAAS